LGVARNDTILVFAAADAPWVVRGRYVNDDGTAGLRMYWPLCPRITVGLWHSHPLALAQKLWGEEREYWCRASPPDQGMWLSSDLPLLMISTRVHHTCVYVRLPDGEIGAHFPP
jgi:hypothetical protein